MDLAGAHPEWFGAFYALSFLVSFLVAAWIGYRRGWPPASWLIVLLAAGIGGVLGAKLLPLGLDGIAALLSGTLPETPTRRIPGAVAGALLLAVVARGALGIRRSVLDPLAYGGLASLAVVRIGCFIAGCCFGTPTDAPWGVTYVEGSFAHGFHLAHGIVEAGAAAPHPVHPIPLYDLAFALLGLMLLPRLSRILKAPGSLCWATVAGYAAYRFVQDVARANETVNALGLTSVQVVCAGAALLALAWVVWRERGDGHEEAEVTDPGLVRLLVVFGSLVAVYAGLGAWWTGAEAAAVLTRLVPAGAALAVVAWRRHEAVPVRWGATLAAAGLPLVLGFQLAPADSTDDRFTFWAVDAHAGQGIYEDADICSSSLHEYQTGGVALAHVTVDPDRQFSREVGLRVYGGTQQTPFDVAQFDEQGNPLDPAPERGLPTAAVAPYVQVEGRQYGGHIGVQLGRVPLGSDEGDDVGIAPSLGFRVGPRSFHMQGGFLDNAHFGAPASRVHVGVGAGRQTERGQEVRFNVGASLQGPYVSGAVPIGDLTLEPMVTVAIEEDGRTVRGEPLLFRLYQTSLRARYPFNSTRRPVGRIPALPDEQVRPLVRAPVPPDTTAQ